MGKIEILKPNWKRRDRVRWPSAAAWMVLLKGWLMCSLWGLLNVSPGAQVRVPAAPPPTAIPLPFHDKHYGVRFEVPAGWELARKDGQVSTFHLDARSAARNSRLRSVAAIDFNPFPLSTFSGALFYYSVEQHSNDRECERQAYEFGRAPVEDDGVKVIGGMDFVHGHDEHGGLCVEARDEVYTAYRKGACYRFDLEVNTFCAKSSGAQEMTVRQFNDIEHRMQTILASVVLDWKRAPKGSDWAASHRGVKPGE